MIKILSAGTYSSLQDAGRFGYRSYGVPISGAMDHLSAGLARELVGGDATEALLEFYQQGPILRFNKKAHIAIVGLNLKPMLNNKPIPTHRLITVPKSQELHLGSTGDGLFGYLAIQGGFKAPVVLGSKSYYKGISPQYRLQKGAVLDFTATQAKPAAKSHLKVSMYFNDNFLEAYPGPEFDELSDKAKEILTNQTFTLGRACNRMGYRFEGHKNLGLPGILTGPVQPGTVQLTPGGELIAMMRDAQTTGGYSRVLQLSEHAIAKLAQQKPGAPMRFSII